MIPVVALGASAGGLSEIEIFLSNMPVSAELAIVIIQHLSPHHQSFLSEIAAKYTEMNVSQIKSGTVIETGNVYIIPPGRKVHLESDKLVLTERPSEKTGTQLIDDFFESMGETLGEKGIAVILSGAGSDGCRGIKTVKEEGGLTLVQRPDTAEYSSMPHNAVKTGLIDFIVPVQEMPKIILDYLGGKFMNRELTDDKKDGKTSESIRRIFEILQGETGHDFSYYKKNTIFRRIQRRLTVNSVSDLESYVGILNKNPEEAQRLLKELLISVTGFFRDKEVFDYMKKKIIPKAVSGNASGTIRIWVPACATGEEVYSIAILFLEYLKLNKLDRSLQIFASDIDAEAVEKARRGFYPEAAFSDVDKKLLTEYFNRKENGYQVKNTVRDNIVFATHNLLADPPYSRMDLVSCRNLLIYLENSLQRKVLSLFHYILNPGGILVTGKSENLGASSALFTAKSRSNKVFIKIEGASTGRNIPRLHMDKNNRDIIEKPIHEETVPEIARKYILENLSPPCIITDYSGEMIYVQGRTGKFLENASGTISMNIIKNAREGLSMPLSIAVRKAKLENKEIIQKGIRVKTNGDFETFDLSVAPLKNKNRETKLLIITFLPPSVPVSTARYDDPESIPDEIIKLEAEIAEKDLYLNDIIEQLESANEELRSSNEESQSTTEELQSTNEELETSKEELQSVNEELVTTNNELNIKVEELSDITNNLQNFLEATDIATIFVDKELRIFNFTPASSSIIDLLPSDKGRSIVQFLPKLHYNGFISDIEKVIESLQPIEAEVRNRENRHFWMRITPYRTTDDRVEGAVITFTDITEKKTADSELKLLYDTIDNSLDGFDIIDKNGLFIYANSSYLKMWGYDDIKEVIGTSPSLHCADPEMPGIIISTVTEKGKADFEFKAKRKDGSIFDAFMSVTTYEDINGNQYYAGFSQDITQRKLHEAELEEYRSGLESLVKEKSEELFLSESRHRMISSMASDYSYSYIVNEYGEFTLEWSFGAFEKITGYEPARMLNSDFIKKLIHPDDLPLIEQRRKAYCSGKPVTSEIRIITRYGEIKWIQDKVMPEMDKKTGKIIRIVSTASEITRRKNIEQELMQSERKFKNIAENIPGLVFKYKLGSDGSEKLLYLSKSIESIFKIPHQEALNDVTLIWNSLHKKDRSRFRKTLTKSAEKMSFFDLKHRIDLNDGSIKWLHTRGTPVSDTDGGIIWDILSIDITEQKAAEEIMHKSNEEKEILLKELHHRVKNNLQLISSMLQLQSAYIKDKSILRMYAENQYRIRSIAHLHELIYHSNDLNRIDLDIYINNISDYLIKSYQNELLDIRTEISIYPLKVNLDIAIPIGLIVTELLSNCLKHAFNDTDRGNIIIRFQKSKGNRYSLVISDDGSGIDKTVFNEKNKSFGIFIITSLVMQLNGDLHVRTSGGTEIDISFSYQD